MPAEKTTCSFCESDTSFLAHRPHLCIRCGDRVQGFSPTQVLELTKRFAEATHRLKTLDKRGA